MTLIAVGKNEIVVGQSLPWMLFDLARRQLLNQGEVVRDDRHRNELLAAGASREMSLEESGDEHNEDSLFAGEETVSAQTGADKPSTGFTFDDMKLRAEDRLQLEPPAKLGSERFSVKVVGFLRGASLLVTTPITANGLRLQLVENDEVILRSFCGQNAFAFASSVKRMDKINNEYLHLSFPESIKGVIIRKAPRIKTNIIAAIQNHKIDPAKKISARISDISANGVSLDAKQQLGNKGDVLNMAFRVHLHQVEAFLSVKGVIRAMLSDDAGNSAKSGLVRHGVEFQDLQPNDSVILQSMIYQQMIENPHKLM